MAKAEEFVTDALEDILEQAAEEPIAKADAQAALRYLNDMMSMWAAKGVDLGYTIVSNLGDEVTVPLGAYAGIKAHLSILLAPKFGASVTQELMMRAMDGWKAILNLTRPRAKRAYPSILPMGSGNYVAGTYSRFYPELDPAIMTETGGLIALEDLTLNS